MEKTPEAATQPLAPIAGLRGFCVLSVSQSEYLALVDYTVARLFPSALRAELSVVRIGGF